MQIGLISDTHGLLRPEALAALAGSDHIVHAGDIGNAAILDALRSVAPLTVIRGNNDTAAWAHSLRETERLGLGGLTIHVVHDLKDIDFDPRAEGVDVVVHGHSHRPTLDTRDGVLYCNPGSAGPRRFRLPISVAVLTIVDGAPQAQLLTLDSA